MVNWDDLRFFLALADTGSMSAAAEALEVSQPTMGRRVRELESRLEAKLFERTASGYALTEAGEQIRELARDIERKALAIERRVQGVDTRRSGRVCIALTEGLARYWLVPKLDAFSARCPSVELELSIGIQASDLVRREADIALRMGEPGSEQLVGRKLGHVTFGLYGSKAYFEQRGEPRTLAALARHDIIESERGIAKLVQARVLRKAARGAHVTLRCDHIGTQMEAACSGLGLVSLATYMTRSKPQLKRVLPSAFDVKLDLWLLAHRDVREAARVRAVMEFIAEELRRDAVISD
ncbi:MAG: LysR family transcriptional regulator [Pseudomonadota bacterium]